MILVYEPTGEGHRATPATTLFVGMPGILSDGCSRVGDLILTPFVDLRQDAKARSTMSRGGT